MDRKTLLYLFIGISILVVLYLYYVDAERKNSIEKYFPQPQVGDIYKIKADNEDGKQWLGYLKLIEVSGDRRVFMRSKLISNASADFLLNHYDSSSTIIYSAKELKDIKEGKWNNYLKDNTSLVEIVRRK